MRSINQASDTSISLAGNTTTTAVSGRGTLLECAEGDLGRLLGLTRESLRQPGWLALVAPPSRQVIAPLLLDGIDVNRLLFVHRAATLDPVWAAEQALVAGRCALVLCWTDALDSRDRRRLALAARRSGGTVVLLTRHADASEDAPAVEHFLDGQRPVPSLARLH